MFDRFVWNRIDGCIYIARESHLLERKAKQEREQPKMFGPWSNWTVTRKAFADLKVMEPMGEA